MPPRFTTLLLSVSLGLSIHGGAALVAQWTFEGANPLADSMGNFGDLALQGDAVISSGSLDVNGSGTTASGWARTAGAGGVAIGNKTLVSWITLQSLGDVVWAGSALSLDAISVDRFDGIVFGEIELNRWMNGSNGHSRSPATEFSGAGAIAVATVPIQLAYTYTDQGGGNVLISGYLDGVSIGSYISPNYATWGAGDQEAVFGARHNSGVTPGALDALIHEARIYDTALSQAEIQGLTMIPEPSTTLLGVLSALMLLRRRR